MSVVFQVFPNVLLIKHFISKLYLSEEEKFWVDLQKSFQFRSHQPTFYDGENLLCCLSTSFSSISRNLHFLWSKLSCKPTGKSRSFSALSFFQPSTWGWWEGNETETSRRGLTRKNYLDTFWLVEDWIECHEVKWNCI